MKSAIKEIGVNKKVMSMLMLTVLTIVLISVGDANLTVLANENSLVVYEEKLEELNQNQELIMK